MHEIINIRGVLGSNWNNTRNQWPTVKWRLAEYRKHLKNLTPKLPNNDWK